MNTETDIQTALAFSRRFGVALLFLVVLVGVVFTVRGWWNILAIGVWLTLCGVTLFNFYLIRRIEGGLARESGNQPDQPS